MKRMRVVAQISPVEEALFSLTNVLTAFFSQSENTVYGIHFGHDGTTDQGYLAPWGETETEVELEIDVDFSAAGDDSSIDVMLGSTVVGNITGIPGSDGSVEFILDLGKDTLPIGDTNMPLEEIAVVLHAKIDHLDELDDIKNELAGEKFVNNIDDYRR